MKKLRKILGMICCCLFLGGCACETSLSTTITYEVTNGDFIDLELDIKDGYSQDAKMPFTISKDEETILMGRFLSLEEFDAYVDLVSSGGDEHAERIRMDEKDGNEYICYRYRDEEDKEYNFVVKVKDSSSAVLMSSTQSDEVAEAGFEAITFTKKK